jgi:hypothetical protein
MNTMRKMVTGLVMAAGLAASSASVLAQTPPSGAGTPAPQPGQAQQGPRGMSPEQREAKMKEQFNRMATQMHDKLKLNASQEQAWNTYLQSMTPPPRAQRPDRAQWEKMTTPQRMEQHLAQMKDHEAQMSKRLDATKTFYGQLNPDQQKTFDSETARMMHGMMGDHHGRGHGGPGKGGQPQGAPQQPR